jgi:hypothetical protein
MVKPRSLTWTRNAACSGKQKSTYFDYNILKDSQGMHEGTVDVMEIHFRQTELR